MTTSSHWPTTSPDLLHELRQSGDSPHWGDFAGAYGESLQRFCRKKGLALEDAEDVTQQVFLQLLDALPKFEYSAERGRFRCWLATIAWRAILKHRRKASRQPGEIQNELDAYASKPRGLEELPLVQLMQEAFQRLQARFQPDEWQVFERAFVNNEPRSLIAREMERPLNWVYQTTFRVLRGLEEETGRLADDAILGIE